MRPVIWSDDALDEYDDIIRYIGERNYPAALRIRDKIKHATDVIAKSPGTARSGRVAGTWEKSVTGTRYVVAFALKLSPSGKETVMILRIIHTARDWKPGEWPKS